MTRARLDRRAVERCAGAGLRDARRAFDRAGIAPRVACHSLKEMARQELSDARRNHRDDIAAGRQPLAYHRFSALCAVSTLQALRNG